jgi:hypothetical protein
MKEKFPKTMYNMTEFFKFDSLFSIDFRKSLVVELEVVCVIQKFQKTSMTLPQFNSGCLFHSCNCVLTYLKMQKPRLDLNFVFVKDSCL